MNSFMSSQPTEHLHPVLDFAHRLVSRLDSLADAPLMSMRPEDKRAALVTLARGRAQLDALALRLLADAERTEVTVESGAGTAADWVAVETRQVRREARADLRLAEKVEQHEVLAAAIKARWVCEQHQDKPQFHDDCPGPGMPCPRCNPEANDKATVIENVDVRSTDNQTD